MRNPLKNYFNEMNIELDNICLCCNSQDVVLSDKKSFFNLPVLKCNNCFSHFIHIDEKTNLDTYYEEEYWEKFRNNNVQNIEHEKICMPKTNQKVKISKLLFSLGKMIGVDQSRSFSQHIFFKQYVHGRNLFEIGVGEGTGLKFFEKNNFIVSGLEPSKKNITIINKKLKNGICELGTIEDNLPKKKFDVIVMSHVLEHVKNPSLVLSKLKNNLSENGILFIEVPNCESEKQLDGSIRLHPHVTHFTKYGLKKLAENTRYDILKTQFVHSELNSLFDFIRYGAYWICKKDFFSLSSSQNGNVIRVVLSKKKEN